jgi:hypothetical protein
LCPLRLTGSGEHAVGLVAVNREPLSPLVAALFAAAKKMKVA